MESLCRTLEIHMRQVRLRPIAARLRARERYKYQGDTNISKPINLEDLRKFFAMLSDMFFNGTLAGHCIIGTYPASRPEIGGTMQAYCSTSRKRIWANFRDSCFKYELAHCRLIFSEVRGYKQPWREVAFVLGILLHEMTHDYLNLFTCRCAHGCEQEWKVEDDFEGNGPFWQTIASAVESEMRGIGPNRFNMFLRLYRGPSLAIVVAKGAKLPEEPLLSKPLDAWVLKREELFEDIRRLKETIR